ncbi:hypothetical protein [Caballeronia sp. BCC1704]|uniref:hypothetical protein n=1 Tax=Caballeronia sp. BCC1704 TaxID=2676300 RepID=UPI00158F553B|nr:hypothetical protein [Caballeronia sp. BCC1704]
MTPIDARPTAAAPTLRMPIFAMEAAPIAIMPMETMLPTPSGKQLRYSIGSSTNPTCG